jgi:diguanylate cyclase (GGDEF)-like protein/PAS domain S-box-containing protein
MLKLSHYHRNLHFSYRLTFALVLFSVALFFRFYFLPQTSGSAFITFYPAIILSFYFCGVYIGALVTMMTALVAVYYFIPPYHQLSVHAYISSSLIFFGVTTSLIGFFISRLHRQIEKLDAILDNEMIGSMMLRNRKIIWCNKAMSTILGYPQSKLLGATTSMLFADASKFEIVGREAYPLKTDKPYRTQFEMIKADGTRLWVDISGAAIPYDASLSLWLLSDISTQKKLEQALQHKVNHDFLTGLNTRDWFMSQASIELNRATRTHSPLSLLMLDIDYFKRVNDTHGHQAGDLVLKNVASLTKKMLRDFDLCARLGGEEFAILLPETNKDKAHEVAERLRLGIERAKIALHTEDSTLSVTVSIGVSSITSSEDNVDMLINKADKALYEAKNTGRNRVCIAP